MSAYVAVIGAFDGVHLGHRALVASCVADARERGARAVAVTFSPDPVRVLRSDMAPRDLLAPADRVALLRGLGLDEVVCVPFDAELARLPYERFVAEVLGGIGDLSALHVGADFRMGANGLGTPEALAALGAERGFSVCVEPYVEAGGARVSSTRIRELLAGAGSNLAKANALLARPHYVRGEVAHGRGEGTGFGFPTANVLVDDRSQLPAEAVYGGYVELDGADWPAAINVGKPRSLGFAGERGEQFLEANLIGYEGDAYGKAAKVTFVQWLRDPRTFASLEELEATVLGNIAWVRDNL